MNIPILKNFGRKRDEHFLNLQETGLDVCVCLIKQHKLYSNNLAFWGVHYDKNTLLVNWSILCYGVEGAIKILILAIN